MKIIKFQGVEYLFTSDSLEEGGPLTTIEDYKQGLPSYAHLFPNGIVKRYNETIGCLNDITIVKEIPKVEINDELRFIKNLLTW